jgi:hypothetical protein
MPTLTECLAAELTPRLEALWESSPQFRGLVDGFKRLFEQIGLGIRSIAESPPSPAYERVLIKRFRNPFVARAVAKLAVRSGRRRAAESKRRGPVFRAIRFLAQPDRRKDASLRRASLLLAAWEETSIIEGIFDEAVASQPSFRVAHPNPFEFVSLLKSAVERREIASRLREIAAALTPHLLISRGPRISAASATHEFILENGLPDQPRAYTWDPTKEDFTDGLTQATRQEFGNLSFSPQAARRRVKRRRLTKVD